MPRRVSRIIPVIALLSLGLLVNTAAGQSAAGNSESHVRLNQIQVIGTHNSYHAGLEPGIARLMQQQDPKAFASLDYSHGDLSTQLDHGIRQIELDIFADAKGGRYAHPYGLKMVAQAGLSGGEPPFDPQGKMLRPGFKVMHVQDIDFVSNCQPFTTCLEQIRAWSRSHPRHVPVFILVETKQSIETHQIPLVTPEPFTEPVLDALDATVLSVFPRKEIVTPDDVRGRYPTLESAILKHGWPTLDASRGKVVFLLDQEDVSAPYLAHHPSLRGRVFFTHAEPGHPDAAFLEREDPFSADIPVLVKKGYLVRTRSDEETVEARDDDVRRRDAALASGAQIVSTDYPYFEPARWTGYSVSLPLHAVARCNPVDAPVSCNAAVLASPDPAKGPAK